MATLNLKRPSGSWGEMPQSVWNEISGAINEDWSDDSTPPQYTAFFTYGKPGQTGVLQLSQSILDSWHYNLGEIGLTCTSSLQIEYKAVGETSSSGCFPYLPEDVTSHN